MFRVNLDSHIVFSDISVGDMITFGSDPACFRISQVGKDFLIVETQLENSEPSLENCYKKVSFFSEEENEGTPLSVEGILICFGGSLRGHNGEYTIQRKFNEHEFYEIDFQINDFKYDNFVIEKYTMTSMYTSEAQIIFRGEIRTIEELKAIIKRLGLDFERL